MIIYEKNTGGLIKSGGRSISKFPSGLIRVDQLYVGKTGEETSHRKLMAYGETMPDQVNTTTIDGLYIFPDVQESSDGTGFTKYQCSAYGRTTEEYREISRAQSTITEFRGGFFNLYIVISEITGSIVKKKGEFIKPEDFSWTDEFLTPKDVRWVQFPQYEMKSISEININNGVIPSRTYQVAFNPPDLALSETTIRLRDPEVKITAQRNFGKWVEYEFEANRSTEPNTTI